MQKFKVGDVVEVIFDGIYEGLENKPDIHNGEVYTVMGIYEKNGIQHLDIGLNTKFNYIRCRHTFEKLDINLYRFNIQWCSADRFKKIGD